MALPLTVGKYQVLERLAVGGMAELFKARVAGDHGFEKLVAIKKILPHLATDPQFVHMFVDEARLTARLDHPNIVQVFELGTDADTPYIAMQLVDGSDALGLLRECGRTRRRVPPALAALIARDVLDALDHAHHAVGADGEPMGLVHRDVSPGNILLSRRGDVKLTDFGIARAVARSQHTEAGILKGKYGYMSPEQVSGGELDGRSDVFSLGVVLAELLMGRRLFAAPSDLDVLLMVRAADLTRLAHHADELPAELRAIVERALRRRVEERWPGAAVMRDALTAWLDDQGRPGHRELAAFIAGLEAAPTAEVADAASAPATLGGADLRPTPTSPSSPAGSAPTTAPGRTGHGSRVTPAPHETGDLRQVSVVRVLHRLARARVSGQLVLEGRAGILKEVYLLDGHPRYVSSNVTGERLGEFLVAQGAITRSGLERAVEAMPRFGGRLADTLVALGLLAPLEAYRLLTSQVTAKLMDACGWAKGRYRWYLGRTSPFEVQPLHLDAFRVLAAGASSLPAGFVEEWLAARADRRPHPAAAAADTGDGATTLADFGLGDALARVHSLADGHATLGELAARLRGGDARVNFARLAYLLVETERLALPAA